MLLLLTFLVFFTTENLNAQETTLTEDLQPIKKPTRAIPIGSYELLPTVDEFPFTTSPLCTRTYINNVCWGSPALSHYVLGLGTCFTANDIEAVYIQSD
jgi:hypothetical protein